MQIAYLSAAPGRTDRLIARTVDRLEARGLVLAGTVATDLDAFAGADCGTKLHLLPARRPARLFPAPGDRSPGGMIDACSVDEVACAALGALARAQALVVNSFGRVEAEGRGFVPVIAAALDRNLPVLVGVSDHDLPKFLDFSGGRATALPESPVLAADWVLQSLRRAA